MKKNRFGILAAALAAFALVASIIGCGAALSDSGSGSLTVEIENSVSALTLVPSISMDVYSYTITGSGPDGASFAATTTGESVTAKGLDYGSWTILVYALNESGMLIGSGTSTVTVGSDAASVNVSVEPIEGTGTLSVSVSWPSEDVLSPSIYATLTPALGTAQELEFEISDSTASYSSSEVGNGYYTLSLILKDGETSVAGAVEIVRIIADQETSGSYEFSNINSTGGSISVSIDADMQNPLEVTLSGASETQVYGSSGTLCASVADYSGNIVYFWYINGELRSTCGSCFCFGEDEVPGYYRVDVLAYAADGSRAGSDTADIRIVLDSTDPYPLIIAHRGASGARPEHSIEAYRLAIEWGADYVEQDVVSSKDGVLMCLHDVTLSATTDVEDKFPDRYAVNDEGEPVNASGTVVDYEDRVWLPKDFTREELGTLLLKERYNSTTTPRTVSHTFDYKVGSIPTFEEAVQFIRSESKRLNKVIGLYIETKAPQLHKDWGLPMEDELLRILNKYGYTDETSPVLIQSFEDTNLMELSAKTDIRLIQLVSNDSSTVPYGNQYSYADMSSAEDFARIAEYAYGVGPNQKLIIGNSTGVKTDYVTLAHAAGLQVHSYTVRNDSLPTYIKNLGYSNDGYPGEGEGGYRQMKDLLEAGVDGFFTDFSNTFYRLCEDLEYR